MCHLQGQDAGFNGSSGAAVEVVSSGVDAGKLVQQCLCQCAAALQGPQHALGQGAVGLLRIRYDQHLRLRGPRLQGVELDLVVKGGKPYLGPVLSCSP